MTDQAKFSLGQTVIYKGRLYKVISGQIMGVTGWRYELKDDQGNVVHAAWQHDLTGVQQ